MFADKDGLTGAERKKIYDASWVQKNKDKVRATSRRYTERHHDEEIERYKRYREENPEKVKETQLKYASTAKGRETRRRCRLKSDLKTKYGMTLEEYDSKAQSQNNVCMICKGTPNFRLAVDHCHTTGKIRDLLCHRCNLTLGALGEDIELMHNMINYIKKWHVPSPSND